MRAKIHTAAPSHIGGSRLAAELGVVSADRLNFSTDDELVAPPETGVTAGVTRAGQVVHEGGVP